MQKNKSDKDRKIFREKYEKLSSLKIPLAYLNDSNIYTFKKQGSVVGGFILSNRKPLRTVNTFASPENAETKLKQISKADITEVCCFWIERKYRKNKFFSMLCWIKMAYTVSQQKERFVLYGTNSKGLAKMYGFPKVSVLVNSEELSGLNNYIFISKRIKFFGGVMQIMLAKLKGNKMNSVISNNKQIENVLRHELSF